MIDISATHSFISLECVNNLKLEVFSMNISMVIDTLTNGLVPTLLVCLNCPFITFSKDFRMALVRLPLSQLSVILGMNWLEFNHMYINCFDKTILFLKPKENGFNILIC